MPVIRRVPEDYASVAAAHSAAESRDIIYITGRFSESITATKAVHFVGAGGLSDAVFSTSTANGLTVLADSALTYNLSSVEAAKVPFLLVENLLLSSSNAYANQRAMTLSGVAPQNGILLNRCYCSASFANNASTPIRILTSGWMIQADRCRLVGGTATSPLAVYTAPLLEGALNKCLISPALQSTDLAQNWTTQDVVTTATTGYGPVPTDGIALRMDDLDYEAYRIYGTVTDIPNFVDPEDFEIRLFPEKTAQGNDMGLFPLETKPLTLATQGDDTWSGSWEFNYLLPTRRYGILINPPDGMQGHWLRWYNPAVE